MALFQKQVGVDYSLGFGADTTLASTDDARAVVLTPTVQGITATLPAPTDTTVPFTTHVVNTGTVYCYVNGYFIAPGRSVQVTWSGAAWVFPKTTADIIPIGGEYELDANEFNAWQGRGIYDDRHTGDLGNVGAAANRLAGGLMFPYAVQLMRFRAWHRNSSAAATAWGWRINAQSKTADSNAVTNTEILRECVGTGATATAPRDYLDNANQLTDIDLSTTTPLPAGDVLTLGVEAPTVGGNFRVQVMSGYMEFERV